METDEITINHEVNIVGVRTLYLLYFKIATVSMETNSF